MKKIHFEKIKTSLKTKTDPVYFLYGKDIFLLDKSVEVISNALNISFPYLNIVKFNNENLVWENVVRALNTEPAFSDKKLVIVDVSYFNKQLPMQAIENYILQSNPLSVLIIIAGENAAFKLKADNVTYVDCDKLSQENIVKFIISEVSRRGKKITQTAIKMLMEKTNNNMMKINNEIVKLTNYVDADIIENADIELNVENVIEFKIFELTESLARKNDKKVYEILHVLKLDKDGFKGLLSLIYNHFRRLMFVSLSKDDARVTAARLGVKEYAASQYLSQSKLFPKKKIKQICDYCSHLDFLVKQSKTQLSVAVDLLVLDILNG